MYLVAVLDWYSRYVLSWRISNTLDVSFCRAALKEALEKGSPEIFNSDQGSQFTSDEFTRILLSKEITISMDGRGRAFDNIFTERLWRSVKYEKFISKIIRFVVKHVRVWRSILHFITRGGTTNHWNIKHRMKFILEFLQ